MDERGQCKVAFGQGGHYVAWSTREDWTMCYPTDTTLSRIVDKRSRIEVCSLGVDDAYFVMQTDGKFWYNLMENYETLEGG